PIAVFRGSLTGNDRTINNTRVQARIKSLEYPSYLDVAITPTFKYYMFENLNNNYVGCVYTTIDDDRIYDEKNQNYKNIISAFEQGNNYKYILHIDGFVAAWRMALEMLSMSVILKVDSPWIEHYYHDLIP
ncbi:MAG: glycosyl transferase family 90, partial [bacterium]